MRSLTLCLGWSREASRNLMCRFPSHPFHDLSKWQIIAGQHKWLRCKNGHGVKPVVCSVVKSQKINKLETKIRPNRSVLGDRSAIRWALLYTIFYWQRNWEDNGSLKLLRSTTQAKLSAKNRSNLLDFGKLDENYFTNKLF